MFQSRSQTGHGYNEWQRIFWAESAHIRFNPVHKPVMVTTVSQFQTVDEFIWSFNPVHKPVMVTTNQRQVDRQMVKACFNPVHKPVMVTTLMPILLENEREGVSIPFTNRSWLQQTLLTNNTTHAKQFQSRSQTGHGYNGTLAGR